MLNNFEGIFISKISEDEESGQFTNKYWIRDDFPPD